MTYGPKKELPGSTLHYILLGLIPYTEANMKLAFRPSYFFADLEKISNKRRQTIRNAYYQAQKNNLIIIDDRGIPQLTIKGKARISVYKPKYLGHAAQLMIMFDIPEKERWKRQHLRALLKELSFTPIQKSIWASNLDYKDYVKAEIKQLGLEDYVQIYEARKINI